MSALERAILTHLKSEVGGTEKMPHLYKLSLNCNSWFPFLLDTASVATRLTLRSDSNKFFLAH
jgi:hypothetical protein